MPGVFLPQRGLRQKPPVGSRFNPNCSLLHGLQAMYVFNEGGGTTLAEVSGQHPAATVDGGSGSIACWTNGLFGTAGQFTSTIGYANCGNICDNMANFTVSLWFRSGSTLSNSCILGKLGSGGTATGQGWCIQWAGTQPGVFTQLSGGSTYRQINTSSSYADSKWHHGVFTVSGYVPQNIYIDGVAVPTTPQGSGTVTTTTTTASMAIGADTASGNDWWNGSLDIAGIWNRLLGVDEIERLYVEPLYFMSPGGISFLSRGRTIKRTGVVQTLTPSGIVSQETQGASGLAEYLLPSGILSLENLGSAATATNNARNVFPSGLTTLEAEGAIIFSQNPIIQGIISAEAEGAPNTGLTLLPLGITTRELFGALQTALATHNPINISLRRRPSYAKPQPGTRVNSSSPLAQGLAGGWIFNEGGGLNATEVLSGVSSGFSGSPSLPAWGSGPFGSAVHFPGGTSGGRLSVLSQPAFTDLGLNGPMSVSFWYNYDAAQLSLSGGSSVMGKNDSTDGTTGFTHGWVINSDNWQLISGNPVNTGPQNIKLEFERSGYNKQGGIPAPTTPGVWHHIVMTTAGGASTPATNDYTIYLDGVLQQNIFFVSGTGTDTTSDSGYNFAIGSHPSGSNPFAGYLDVVLLYNRVLSSSEAQQLYTDPFCFMNRRTRRIRATHPTGNLTITPLGIISGERLGAINIPPAQVVSALGIASNETTGALQAAIAIVQNLHPGSIITLESLGADTVIVAVPTTTPTSRAINPQASYRILNLQLQNRIM